MKLTDQNVIIMQFVGIALSVLCMIIGGSIYLYNYASYPISLEIPAAITTSKKFLMTGLWLLISMPLLRVFMVLYLFVQAKEKVLSIVSFIILIILSVSLLL